MEGGDTEEAGTGLSPSPALGQTLHPHQGCATRHSLGEVGQVLGDFGDEGERAGGAVVGVLLQQVEERGGHDGWAEEAQEQGGADEPLADVRPAAAAALLPPRGEHLLELPGEDAMWGQGGGGSVARLGPEQRAGSGSNGTEFCPVPTPTAT